MPFWVSVIRGVPGNSESPWSLWVASATGDSLCRCEGLCQGGVSVFMGFLSWVPLHPLSFWVFRVTTEALSLSLSRHGGVSVSCSGLVVVGFSVFVGPYPITELP